MPDQTLRGCRVLVVEDEYMLADELVTDLQGEGATVLGPVGTVGSAIDLIKVEEHVDAVLLDINLGGELAFPVADLLLERGMPFVFTTGYDTSAIPTRFEQIVRCEKPLNMGRVMQAIGHVLPT